MSTFDRIKHKLHKWITCRFYRETNHDIANTLLLTGTGRSGTSWLAETLNYQNQYHYMFEPFHAKHVKSARPFGDTWYLPPEDNQEKYLQPARKILRGKLRNSWVDQYNHSFFPKKRLIKSIRINLLLPWLNNHFPQIKIIHLLRHPCAVAASKLKLGWPDYLNEFLADQNLITDLLKPHVESIKNETDQFNRHIYLWCIENALPLNYFSGDQLHFVFYENLCTTPEATISKIYNYLDKEYEEKIFNKLEKPSPLAEADSAINTGDNRIKKWQQQVSRQQVESAVNILREFNLTGIYAEAPRPRSQSPGQELNNNGPL